MKVAYALRNLAAIAVASGIFYSSYAQPSGAQETINSILAKENTKKARQRCENPEIILDSLPNNVALMDSNQIRLDSVKLAKESDMESVLNEQLSNYALIYAEYIKKKKGAHEEYLKKEKEAEKNLVDILAQPYNQETLQKCGSPSILLYDFSPSRESFHYLYTIVLNINHMLNANHNKKEMELFLTEEMLKYHDELLEYQRTGVFPKSK
jgi:hypothetical protein